MGGAGDPKTLVEVLARLTQLQQFVQGGHGSQSRNFQPTNLDVL